MEHNCPLITKCLFAAKPYVCSGAAEATVHPLEFKEAGGQFQMQLSY